MSGSRQHSPRDNQSAELQELRSQRSLLEAIALDQRKIRKLLAKLQVYNMALPDLIETAAVTNTEIPTPDAVEAAPEVAPEVIQEPVVVEAALEAIVEADSEAPE
jgi:hypothetical protein